ncbi:UNVERIFIED_CONTAM: hypothetical protein NCL1_23560 [Trichonephila clavipes]
MTVSYTRAFGDGPRNFESWSSDVDDTSAGILSPNYHTTPTAYEGGLELGIFRSENEYLSHPAKTIAIS